MLSPIYAARHHVVSENYLAALLTRNSGVAHRYWIERITDAFCYVAYSNPDEYGNDCPIQVMYPVYRQHLGPQSKPTVCIVLDYYDEHGGRDIGDCMAGADATDSHIQEWMETPVFRDPESGEWFTREELDKQAQGILMRITAPRDPDNGQPPGGDE